jgi:iron complex outermembrane recepter protein
MRTSTTFTRTALLALALSASTTALAQNQAATQPAADQADAPARTSGEQDIVVTATRREANLQNVPLAVSALSGDRIRNTRVTDFASLTATVPGPTFIPVSGSSGSQIQIRGQVATDDSPGFDTPVAMFIDDIYYSSVASFYPDFFDIEQVAVLRGPQGTTFGRNTVGGAIQVTSRKPQFGETSGSTDVTIRNYNGLESQGFLNIPLGDRLAWRGAYSVKNVDGYQHNRITGNDLNNKKVYSLRGSLRAEPTDTLELLLSGSYTHDSSNGDGAVLYGQGALIASLKAISDDPHDTFSDDDGKNDRDIYAAFLRADLDTSLGQLTSITSYRRLSATYREDIDGSPLTLASPDKVDTNREKQFSQEIRLTSPSNVPVEYVAGLYYLNQKVYRSEQYNFQGDPGYYLTRLTGGVRQSPLVSGDNKTISFAAFAEGKWNVTDQLALTGGIRWTHDNKKSHIVHSVSSALIGPALDVRAKANFSAFTPRAIVEYKPVEDVMLYGSVSKGWKSGGFPYAAPTVAQSTTPLKPEKSTSYELGAKTRFLDRKVTLNVAAFLADTKDLQVRGLVGTTLIFQNAGKARTKGVEVELSTTPVDGLNLGGTYAYVDSYYRDFQGCSAGGADCSGNQRPFTPKNTLTLFGQYRWDMPSLNGSITVRAEDRWASTYQFLSPLNDVQSASRSAQKNFANAFVTYAHADGKWSVQAWSRNIFNKTAVTFGTNYFFYLLTNAEFNSGLRNADRTSVTEPRTYGLTFHYAF